MPQPSEMIDRAGEAGTAFVSDAAGAVVDPKTAATKLRTKLVRPRSLLVVATLLALLSLRRRSRH